MVTDSQMALQGNSGDAACTAVSLADLAFCESRLISLMQLVNWNIDRPSRPADALLLGQGLVRDAYGLAISKAGTREGDVPPFAAMKSELTKQTGNPVAAALEACVSLLLRPWRDWAPDQQMRLAEQLANKLDVVVANLRGAPSGWQDLRGRPRTPASYVRFGICAAAIVTLLFGGWWFYKKMSAPQFYATRMSDLDDIQTALKKYRQKNGVYPLSAENGTEWNGISWKGPQDNWIPGLVPEYLRALPRDPRMTHNPYQQYIYRSDGKDYKLVVMVPDDCEFVIEKYPEMADTIRNNWQLQKSFANIAKTDASILICNAYGYWTANGKDW